MRGTFAIVAVAVLTLQLSAVKNSQQEGSRSNHANVEDIKFM
jgi:hypothetical protein